jgi:hypothetical protein
MEIHSVDFDNVIKSRYITALTDYRFALNNLVPLIDRLDIQRNIQDSKFYSRLEKDLVRGCIMPPLTLAFIDDDAVSLEDKSHIGKYLDKNIKEGFILDGIQRLNTLQRTFKKSGEELNLNQSLFLNIVICSSMDNLLYRMITLNNGQKPMSARHQIEILTANLFEFEDSNTPIYTEREAKRLKIRVAFNKGDFIKGYLGFLANSTNIENQKIIEEKLDELIADKILDSNLTEDDLEFSEVITLINRFCENTNTFKWFKNANNLIGFCVGIKSNFEELNEKNSDNFHSSIRLFEQAFESFNFSKIKVGRIRRNLVAYYIKNYSSLVDSDVLELVDILSQVD